MDWDPSDQYGYGEHKGHSTLISPEGPFVEFYDPFDLQVETKRKG